MHSVAAARHEVRHVALADGSRARLAHDLVATNSVHPSKLFRNKLPHGIVLPLQLRTVEDIRIVGPCVSRCVFGPGRDDYPHASVRKLTNSSAKHVHAVRTQVASTLIFRATFHPITRTVRVVPKQPDKTHDVCSRQCLAQVLRVINRSRKISIIPLEVEADTSEQNAYAIRAEQIGSNDAKAERRPHTSAA